MVRARFQVIAAAVLLSACSYRVIHDDQLNQDAIRHIVLETAKIRNLPLKRALPVELVNQQVLRAELVAEFAKDPEVEKLRSHEILLKKLGLLPKDADIEKMVLELLTEQVAGYYDPERKIMRLVQGSTDMGNTFGVLETLLQRDLAGEFLMAHELTHALDDQHFDLKTYIDIRGNSDEALARKAFVEGEAMLVGINYMLRKPLKKVAFEQHFAAKNEKNSGDSWDKVPAALKRAIMFEYVDGLAFATEIYNQGGTSALDRTYRVPPRSSEEVLHPEKYLRRNDAPVPVTIASEPPEVQGLALVDDDTMGEIGIISLLEEALGLHGAKITAAGWGGDRYRLYRSKARPDDIGLVWRTVWDSEGDAIEFAANLEAMLNKRFGKDAQNGNDHNVRWKTPEGTFEIRSRPDAVTVLLYP